MTYTPKDYSFEYQNYIPQLLGIFKEVSETKDLSHQKFLKILTRYPKDGNKMFSKNNLVIGFKALFEKNNLDLPNDPDLLLKLQMKPIRTTSGVTPVTILTKPFPCPGQCIFCPNDVRMPKSYLSDEPGAQRAERNSFDPYLQTFDRLKALQNIGHDTDKVEIIILGGTWSYYPEEYQIWFIKRCFQAINDFGDELENEYSFLNTHLARPEHRNQPKNTEIIRNVRSGESETETDTTPSLTYNQSIVQNAKHSGQKLHDPHEVADWEELFFQHRRNELNTCRCVGLVVETRPDNISPEEVIRIRKLGCTKTQIGFQSLDDKVLELNHRGHDVEATRRAVQLLRWAGLKIHAHWMANLYGSDMNSDISDFQKMFVDPDFKPDELKVYPCSLIETAELMDYYKKGLWKPYTTEELLNVIIQVIKDTPQYCRLTRIIRDIPGTDIVVGNQATNFRQIAELEMDKRGIIRQDIRSREIKNKKITRQDLVLDIIEYTSSIGEERFLQFVTKNNEIAGFLRLALPKYEDENKKHPFIAELDDSAIIREIHVYGKTANIGEKTTDKAQHLGLGKELIQKAKEIAIEKGFAKLAVISAIGTREYYRKRGFEDGEMYQVMKLIKYENNF